MLPDVNVWLALTFENHTYHRPAKSWFEKLGRAEAAFCRMTMLGFFRLAQNAAAFPGQAVSARTAWSFYEAFSRDDRVTFEPEPNGIDLLLAKYFVQVDKPSPQSVTDAYLAAFAKLSGHSLYTFDKALQKHPLLK